jgi:hypothetical protein
MSNQTAGCCEQCGIATNDETATAPVTDGAGAGEVAVDRWVDAESALSGPLPADLAAAASEFYGVGPVETLGDFTDATRTAAGGDIAVADLCHVHGDTPHRATAGDETYRFACFYDGVVLARLRSGPVDVRTVSPAGEPIELHLDADGRVEASPPDTVMSFGIAPDATTAGATPTPEEVYGAVCPWVRAFPSQERYEAWAAGTDAPTVGLALETGLPVAAALADGH